jgi:hypothetical protein
MLGQGLRRNQRFQLIRIADPAAKPLKELLT